MIDLDYVKDFALSFQQAEVQPHFEKSSFRIKNKIFATLDKKNKQVVLKLSIIDQSAFSAFDAAIIYPFPGTWGKQGWTIIELTKVKRNVFIDAITTAYCNVAPKNLAKKYR